MRSTGEGCVPTVWIRDDVLRTATDQPVPALATLAHQEHDPIVPPPGTYRMRRQREHAPEAPLSVAD